MTTIWSLKKRDEVAVRVYYSVHVGSGARLLRLERVERFDEVSV